MPLRPSLVRRLTIAFVSAPMIGLALIMVALWPFATSNAEDHVGPDVAIRMLARDLTLDQAGILALMPDARIFSLARHSPDFWFVALQGPRRLSFGPVPDRAEAGLALLGEHIKLAELGTVGGSGRAGDATIEQVELEAGKAIIAAGGVAAESVTFPIWLRYVLLEEFAFIPLLAGGLTLLGSLLAIPIVIRSVRPSARFAQSLDGADLTRRLPERGVVAELLPLVRGFNLALDRVAEAFERRRRFIADVAHELRTPVAVLNMHVEALPEGPNKTDLQRSVFRLGQMVGQMLDVERLSLARRQKEVVDLVELSRAAVAEIAPVAIANGYRIAFDAEAETIAVHGDPHALSRALANLLGNAVAHGGGSGSIQVQVRADRSILVSDEGPGVPVEARERIFEPFRRERWDKDGCGLGLHLVREVMRAHGGDVRLVNAPAGAAFKLFFPPDRGV